MTRSKLSASDREELIHLFKETTETITSLADRFQVSVSTARRVLKTQLSAGEYEIIVTNRLEGRQNKKSASASKKRSEQAMVEETDVIGGEEDPSESLDDIETVDETEPPKNKTKIAPPIRRPKRRSRRRSSAADDASTEIDTPVIDSPVDIESSDEIESLPAKTVQRTRKLSQITPSTKADPSSLSEPDDVALLDTGNPLEVLPIEIATLPNQCYLVVDRASELITPPLREFSELGNIPSSEESAKTLPIFENHKIASRFSRRSQRIIKIPNSDILKKTYSLLNAKGVERILIDGQVFSLSQSQS